MPRIAFSSPEAAAGELMLLMIYPDDEIKRRRANAVGQMNTLTRDADVSELTLPIAMVRDLLNAPSYADVQSEQQDRTNDAQLAGLILFVIYVMHLFRLSPSMRKALYAVARYAATTTYGDKRTVPASEPKLRQCWTRFGPVAPLWAAHIFNLEYPFTPNGKVEDKKDLALFLEVAGGLRTFAVSFVAKGTRSGQPILDPKTTWEMPEGTNPAWLKPAEFPTRLAEFLSNYKAPATRAYGR